MPLVFTVAFLAVSALITAVAIYIYRFNRETKQIVLKLQGTTDWTRYERTYRELCCHYLCLIPFVGKKTSQRLYELLFYKPKHIAEKRRIDTAFHLLAPGIAGICLCTICLISGTYAWFSAAKTSSLSEIKTATYDIGVVAEYDESLLNVPKNAENSYNINISANTEYTVTITAAGTAANGYCTVYINGTEYFTDGISPGGMFTFNVRQNTDTALKITPVWGAYPDRDYEFLERDTLVADALPTVASSYIPDTEIGTETTDKTVSEKENTVPADKQVDVQPDTLDGTLSLDSNTVLN